MKPDDAVRLIGDGEGQRVEFKTTFAEENEAIESLGAFANADGGTVFFGVKPDGAIVGVDLGANTLENFSNKLRRESQPPLSPTIDSLDIDGKSVVSASVATREPGQLFHVFNKALVRVGRTNQVMSPVQQRARLLDARETLSKEQEPAVQISAATSNSGQDGFVWIYNPGVTEKLCVRIRGFYENNPGLELRANWSTGEEERALKKGDKDWCRIMTLEPERVRMSYSTRGELVIPLGKGDALKREQDRRRRGVRIIRFLGRAESSDIEVAQGNAYVVEVVVLSDTREPARAQITYGVGRDTLVMPFNQNLVDELAEKDRQQRLQAEELLNRLAQEEREPESAQ